jgi:hypothetical protein
MTIAVLTFGQEIWKTVIGAVATALFLTIFGYLAADRWGKAREQEREESQKEREREREDFELRTQLVERVSRTAAGMYIACQHARRVLKDSQGVAPSMIKRRNDAIEQLDGSYRQFSVESSSLETLLGARYGIAWHVPPDSIESRSEVFVRWHQIRDLLTLYYFNLKGNFPGDSLQRNSEGFRGRYHSGLKASSYVRSSKSPKADELKAMRVDIRKAYEPALSRLVENMLRDPVAGTILSALESETLGSRAATPTPVGKQKWVDRTRPWAELIAATLGIVGVAFLVWQVSILNSQTRALNEQLQQTYRNDIFSRSLELDKLRIDKPLEYEAVTAEGGGPKMLRKGAVSPKQLAQARALAVYIADFFDYVLELYPAGEYPELAPSDNVPHDDTYVGYLAWSNAIRGTFKAKSLLCETLVENEAGYGTGFISRLRDASLCPGLKGTQTP